MAFSRQSLADLINRVATDFRSRLPGADALLRRSNVSVVGKVLSGAVDALYGYLGFVAKQLFPDSAEKEFLLRHGQLRNMPLKLPEAASGPVVLTGTNGFTAAAGKVLRRSDGATYTLDADATISAGEATVDVTAVTPGLAGNTAEGSSLTFTETIDGVDATATVSEGGLDGGFDTESEEAYRGRVIQRWQNPPQGGSKADYVLWALSVPGVTRAWPLPGHLGPGTVGVAFVMDNDPVSIFPDEDDIEPVQEYIDARRPVTATVTAFAPTPTTVNFTVEISPDTAETRATVTAELADLLFREGEPDGSIPLSHIRQAVANAEGIEDSNVTEPAGPITIAEAHLPVLGTITWL